MANSVYHINKGINKPVEFKGFKAQYIWYLGIGIVMLLVLFAILYIAGVNVYLALILVVLCGIALFTLVYRLSSKYGEHGIKKMLARKQMPTCIKCKSGKFLKRLAGEK